ncbi:MAG: hypothetical protein PVG51_00995 [Desulfosarcina sp.]|jgi:hypothetical protein
MNTIKFSVIFRSPKYPVFVIDKERLFSAFSIDELAECCISSTPHNGRSIVQVVDASGEEFWYSPDQCALSPGFSFKKWTKKEIIEEYNNSINAQLSEQQYSTKSISSKRLEKVVYDICNLLKP